MTLAQAVLPHWIYNLADYRQIFDLSDEDLTKSILVYPGRLSSFNAEMHELQHAVVSADPLYALDHAALVAKADALFSMNKAYLETHLDLLKSQNPTVIDAILNQWKKNETVFLTDYILGREQGRYQVMTDKTFLENQAYDLVLVSDWVFRNKTGQEMGQRTGQETDSDISMCPSPEQLVEKLCHVGKEVRIFPLLDESGGIAAQLESMILFLHTHEYGVEIREVPFNVLKGGNAMLRVWRQSCLVTSEKS